jgi:large subunit ribosomal protein L27Ae
MVVSENIENMQLVEVMRVVNITIESGLINCKNIILIFSHPGYFGKVGMRQFHLNKDKIWRPAVNLDQLWQLAGEEKYKEAKTRTDNKVTVIDVLNHGKAKVLGRGQIPKIPLIVRARYFSKIAEHKIRKAGGICQLRA